MTRKTTIVTYSREEVDQLDDQTDWRRLDALSDEDIDRAIADDPDAAPHLDRDWLAGAELVVPEPKTAISLRLDTDVLRWFKGHGPGYQTRMNAVLRVYMEHHKKS